MMLRLFATVSLITPLFLFLGISHATNSDNSITVGSKTFTESVVLGEIIHQLANASGAKTHYNAQLGGTSILWSALLTGEIDIYPEYTGTLMKEILAKENISTLAGLKQSLEKKGIRMTKPLGFNNTYAIGVTEKLAQKLKLARISDLRNYPELVLGFTNEFMNRADGWPGLQQYYQLPHTQVTGLDHDLAYRGIEANSLQVTDLYATDAEINYYQLRTLEDDLNFFPAYHGVILYRENLQTDNPKLVNYLTQLAGKIDAQTMVAMNAKVKLKGQSESQVASTFLKKHLNINTSVITVSNWQQFLRYTKEHLVLVLISLFAAIVLAIPLGIIAAKQPQFRHLILGSASIIQTIPALALFVFMIPFLGIGGPPAMVALFLYSLLPIIRNTYAGLNDIPSDIKESAEALGLSSAARLRIVELPLATRSILAGIKTSAVINVGTATLGALIGAGGYGQPILTGIRLDDTSLILQGAIPAAALALIVQGIFELLERRLLPSGHVIAN
ncbi:ABC transporter, substrate-binding protein (cluster 13, osmolytes) / ABC transporter, permease protein (cluster 13, osmolytes) [hydrothermal vent metagenome]|uniref:ABC transporter, substrate-binding protein (Cluster 13, osmolytes) / ABC transporter, permease protein (Cluster 13, osmolytes) n=1 Tax=hydrothermal vent metagenome TaxID=652676 RepID=A0A3B1A1R2_9ZZZZ